MMNTHETLKKFTVSDEEFNSAKHPTKEELAVCFAIIGHSYSLGIPFDATYFLVEEISKNPKLRKFLHRRLKQAFEWMPGQLSEHPFEGMDRTFNGAFEDDSVYELFDSMFQGSDNRSRSEVFISWAKRFLSPDWTLVYLMKNNEWQLELFERMKALNLEGVKTLAALERLLEVVPSDSKALRYNLEIIHPVVEAGNSFSIGLSKAENVSFVNASRFSQGKISPVVINWIGSGIASGDMTRAYEYLCPEGNCIQRRLSQDDS